MIQYFKFVIDIAIFYDDSNNKLSGYDISCKLAKRERITNFCNKILVKFELFFLCINFIVAILFLYSGS